LKRGAGEGTKAAGKTVEKGSQGEKD